MSERNCAEYSKAAHEFSALEEESYHQMSKTGSEEETAMFKKKMGTVINSCLLTYFVKTAHV